MDKPLIIIGGFGIPGRLIAELLDGRQVSYSVIERNSATAERCANRHMVVGDMRDEAILREAGIEHARLLAITLPDEEEVLETIEVVRRLRPDIQILARCSYTSSGLKAQRLGADAIIVAEQLVAREFSDKVEDALD